MSDDARISSFSPEILRKARRAKAVKQEWLADQLNVSQSTVSKWENGTRFPDPQQITKIFDFLAIPSSAQTDDWLFRLVRNSTCKVHLMRESDHRLLAASNYRVKEWQRDYSEVAARPLSQELPNDIAVAEQHLRELDFRTKWCCPVVLNIEGRNEGPYCIDRGMLLWEWFMLSDGEVVRLITNIESSEIPKRSFNFDHRSCENFASAL